MLTDENDVTGPVVPFATLPCTLWTKAALPTAICPGQKSRPVHSIIELRRIELGPPSRDSGLF